MDYPERLACLTCGEVFFLVTLPEENHVIVKCGQCEREVIDLMMDENEMPFAVLD